MNTRDFTTVKATHITKRASEMDLNGIKCHLNDEFGLFIQGILAFVAFSTLLCKLVVLCCCEVSKCVSCLYLRSTRLVACACIAGFDCFTHSRAKCRVSILKPNLLHDLKPFHDPPILTTTYWCTKMIFACSYLVFDQNIFVWIDFIENLMKAAKAVTRVQTDLNVIFKHLIMHWSVISLYVPVRAWFKILFSIATWF